MADLRVKTEVIEALEATAAALLAQCRAILSVDYDPPAVEPVLPSVTCLHPNRQKAPRMGAESAWYCPDCHEQGE